MDINEFSLKYISLLDEYVLNYLKTLNLANNLKEAMIYSYSAGGKRIRPLLVFASLEAFSCDLNKGLNTASALELIHTSSLIHDDLPAMDDDDFRRGKLTNHKVFGEATAILAGDALLVNPYELICNDESLADHQKVKLICELCQSCGASGMIGGQQLDIENENKDLLINELIKINENKTGKLIQFALVAGAIIANQNDEVINVIRQAAYNIGIAFQIKDDILDVIGDQEIIGKSINNDKKNHKCTYVSIIGLEESQNRLNEHYQTALSLLNSLNRNSSMLESIFKLIIERNK
jgi:geranylgeranyl diphosphate synthase type II